MNKFTIKRRKFISKYVIFWTIYYNNLKLITFYKDGTFKIYNDIFNNTLNHLLSFKFANAFVEAKNISMVYNITLEYETIPIYMR